MARAAILNSGSPRGVDDQVQRQEASAAAATQTPQNGVVSSFQNFFELLLDELPIAVYDVAMTRQRAARHKPEDKR